MVKISNLLNIEFDSEPVHGDNDKYLKTKIKLYGDIYLVIYKVNKVIR